MQYSKLKVVGILRFYGVQKPSKYPKASGRLNNNLPDDLLISCENVFEKLSVCRQVVVGATRVKS